MPEAYYSWIRTCQVPDSPYYREMFWETFSDNYPYPSGAD